MFQKFTKIIEIKSRSKFAQPVLSLIAFCESIFFPVPPDTILIPIIYFNKKKYLFTIINCTLFSIGGGIIGYCLGFFIFDLIKEYIDVSKQSSFLKSRKELLNSLEKFKKIYSNKDKVPRPDHWSGWNLKPSSIEFWLDGDNRIHERLKYILNKNNNWVKNLLSP